MSAKRGNDYFLNKLKDLQKKVSEEKDAALYEAIRGCIEGFDEMSAFDLAYELDTADATKRLPECVVNVIEDLYLEAVNDEDNAGYAYNNLGIIYYLGRAKDKDYEKCIYYLEKAAALNNPLAIENLGFCYYYGLQDYEKAYNWFVKASLYGGHEATMKLGDMFRSGQYVDKDENMVRVCYFKAKEYLNCSLSATFKREGSVYERIGDLYYEGIGVDKDADQAYALYQIAERGLIQQIREGDPWSSDHLKKVQERLAELKTKISDALPKYDFG